MSHSAVHGTAIASVEGRAQRALRRIGCDEALLALPAESLLALAAEFGLFWRTSSRIDGTPRFLAST